MIGCGTWRETEQSNVSLWLLFLYPLSPLHIDLAVLSSTASSAHLTVGLPRSCPVFCWPGCFLGPSLCGFRTSPSRKQLLHLWLCPLLTLIVKQLSSGPSTGQKCLGKGAECEAGDNGWTRVWCDAAWLWSDLQALWLSVPLFLVE